ATGVATNVATAESLKAFMSDIQASVPLMAPLRRGFLKGDLGSWHGVSGDPAGGRGLGGPAEPGGAAPPDGRRDRRRRAHAVAGTDLALSAAHPRAAACGPRAGRGGRRARGNAGDAAPRAARAWRPSVPQPRLGV